MHVSDTVTSTDLLLVHGINDDEGAPSFQPLRTLCVTIAAAALTIAYPVLLFVPHHLALYALAPVNHDAGLHAILSICLALSTVFTSRQQRLFQARGYLKLYRDTYWVRVTPLLVTGSSNIIIISMWALVVSQSRMLLVIRILALLEALLIVASLLLYGRFVIIFNRDCPAPDHYSAVTPRSHSSEVARSSSPEAVVVRQSDTITFLEEKVRMFSEQILRLEGQLAEVDADRARDAVHLLASKEQECRVLRQELAAAKAELTGAAGSRSAAAAESSKLAAHVEQLQAEAMERKKYVAKLELMLEIEREATEEATAVIAALTGGEGEPLSPRASGRDDVTYSLASDDGYDIPSSLRSPDRSA